MGMYLDISANNRKEWLDKNATFICKLDPFEVPVYKGLCNGNKIPIVLIDNGSFYSAGVAITEDEYARFTLKDDPRDRFIYTCDKNLAISLVHS